MPFAVAVCALLLAQCGQISFYDDIGVLPPGPLALLPDTITLAVGGAAIFTATGGVPPYSFAVDSGTFTKSPSGLSGTYQAPGATGTYVVTVTDYEEATSESTVMVTDIAPLVVTPGAVTIGVGSQITLEASGGTGSYEFTKEPLDEPGTLTPIDGTSTAVYTADSPGIFTIKVTDSSPTTPVTATITVEVIGSLPGTLQIAPTSVALQTSHGITFSASGGAGNYRFSVVSGGGSVDPVAGTYTAPAVDGTATVRVTDGAGATCDADVEIYFPITIIPASVSVQTNGTYTFSATGGIPPYEYDAAQEGTTTFYPLAGGVYTAPGVAETDIVRVRDSKGNASYATVSVAAPPPTWSIQSIDSDLKSGQYASLALDPSPGSPPWIAYYDSGRPYTLRLARWQDPAWSSEAVDGSGITMKYPCSLAINPATHYPEIAYYDATVKVKDLKLASWDGAAWVIETVDSFGDVGQYSSLALDPSTGYPRIAYYDATNKRLKLASWDGAAWVIETVDSASGVGQYASLALDPSTKDPRIAYYDATEKHLKLASWDGGAWSIQTVDSASGVGQYASLALDPSTKNPRIAYYDSTNKKLKYAWFDGSIWYLESADGTPDRGMYASLALDATGVPHISYYDNTRQWLMFADKHGGIWHIWPIDEGPNVGRYTSLRIDASTPGKARIAYYDAGAQDLKFASQED